eukprot:9492117-Pyramimonas_sp.AAC.1
MVALQGALGAHRGSPPSPPRSSWSLLEAPRALQWGPAERYKRAPRGLQAGPDATQTVTLTCGGCLVDLPTYLHVY